MNTGLRIAQFHHRLQLSSSIDHFRFFGATLRGGFGYTFKQACGGLKTSLSSDNSQDVYSLVFNTPVPKDARMMRKYPSCPHPFVFSVFNNGTQQAPNERIITLTLIGSIIKYVPYFIYALQQLGKAGLGKDHIPFNITSVSDYKNVQLYNAGIWCGKNNYFIIDDSMIDQHNTFDSSTLNIQFLSPCRIKYEGRFTDQIEFHVLIRTLLRRISSLAYFHCNNQLDWDFKSIIEDASKVRMCDKQIKWVDQSRYSTRQKRRMTLGGVVGSITYQGNIKPFIPLLLWGEFLHAGKGTSFGLGQYTLDI